MTLQELQLIKSYLFDSKYDNRMVADYNQVIFILNREISLKTMDPRKTKEEDYDNQGRKMEE
jgi:hypothetical protein